MFQPGVSGSAVQMHMQGPLVNYWLFVYVAQNQTEPNIVLKPPAPKRRDVQTEDRQHVTVVRHRHNGPLHDLLLKACPADERGEKSITILANSFNPPLSAWSIHKWIQKGKIPPGRAAEVVDLAEGRVTLADFSPFVYV